MKRVQNKIGVETIEWDNKCISKIFEVTNQVSWRFSDTSTQSDSLLQGSRPLLATGKNGRYFSVTEATRGVTQAVDECFLQPPQSTASCSTGVCVESWCLFTVGCSCAGHFHSIELVPEKQNREVLKTKADDSSAFCSVWPSVLYLTCLSVCEL